MVNKMKADIRATKEPQFQEISFSGNMPSPYEKNLRKQLMKKQR